MEKNSKVLGNQKLFPTDEVALENIATIIETRSIRAANYANSEATLIFWEVGHYISTVLFESKRANYGKQIVATLSPQLQKTYGKSFGESNLRRMIRFAEQFQDKEVVAKISPYLSWSHIIELLSLKSFEAKMYYAQDAASRRLSVRELRNQIARKAFERQEIANTQLSGESLIPFNVFKDPYLLDILGLKDSYLEKDLENAILFDIEAFILEAGHGFAFLERQKRMVMDGEDFILDLLFYHRGLKRLVAIELKLGKFKPHYKGQMEFYLRW